MGAEENWKPGSDCSSPLRADIPRDKRRSELTFVSASLGLSQRLLLLLLPLLSHMAGSMWEAADMPQNAHVFMNKRLVCNLGFVLIFSLNKKVPVHTW